MNNCKVALISFSIYDNSFYINLGEVYDKNIRENIDKLNEININTQYLSNFTVNIKGLNVTLDNIEEIKAFQSRFKLTPIISSSKYIKEETNIEFLAPKLYDMSCMVPLFLEPITRTIYKKNDSKNCKIFIILSYTDPIIRGSIIENCLKNTFENESAFFLTIGNYKGENKDSTCNLNRRYLIDIGVPDENIIVNEGDDSILDDVIESLYILNMVYDTDIVYIGVTRNDIGILLKLIRIARHKNLISNKIRFITNY